MDLNFKGQLEAYGYEVIELDYIDPHFRTSTFIRKPDGVLSAFYDHLWQIPMQLNENDEVSTYLTEVPGQAQNTSSHELHSQTYLAGFEERGLFPWLILFLIFIGIVIGVLFMKAFFTGPYNPPPCGERGSQIEITECVKEIIYPDCSGVMYDSCRGEIIDTFEPPVTPPDWTQGLMWIAIGIVAVAAIILIPKLIPPKKPPQYYPPQQYRRAPGIEYVE